LFKQLFQTQALILPDEYQTDADVKRVYEKIVDGMAPYHALVANISAVCADKNEDGGGRVSQEESKSLNPNEKCTPWKSVFERKIEGQEVQVFVRQAVETITNGNNETITKTYGNIQVHAVLQTDMETIVSQGQEVDLWPSWAPFVEQGTLIGDGVYRFWLQICYNFRSLAKVRVMSRFTRFVDRDRGFLVQIGEPNEEKEKELSGNHKSAILPFTSYTFLTPSVDHQHQPVSFLCQYSVLPCPGWFPGWALRAALSIVAPGIAKGFIAGVEKSKKSAIHVARREADICGIFALTRQIEKIGREYQKEKYPENFRIVPRAVPIELIERPMMHVPPADASCCSSDHLTLTQKQQNNTDSTNTSNTNVNNNNNTVSNNSSNSTSTNFRNAQVMSKSSNSSNSTSNTDSGSRNMYFWYLLLAVVGLVAGVFWQYHGTIAY